MAHWSNWSGKLTAQPDRVHHVRSEADAAAVVADASAAGLVVRPMGASHSHAPLVPTSGVIVDTSGLSGVRSIDTARQLAWIWAGTPIYALGAVLHEAGLALANQGDIDRQSLGGAVATGTHGTGTHLTNLSAAVTGARIAVGGEILQCSSTELPALWRAAQLSLGALGIVTQLQMQLRPAYRLRQHTWTRNIDEVLPELGELASSARHFEFFWFPAKDTVVAKTTHETDDAPEYPIGPEGDRCAWSYEVLPNHRDWPHTEMEYSVALRDGPACLAAIRELLVRDFPDMGHPVEYRSVAADAVWLSPCFERPTATISMHVDVREDDTRLFRACEEVFVAFAGRPHWGKVHYRTGRDLGAHYPHWADWWRVRDEFDPTDTFLNDHLRALRDT